MKHFFLLTTCLLVLTACTAAQTSVPAASVFSGVRPSNSVSM